MSAVSISVTPRSSALSTTRRDAARSIRPPKLLAPSPTSETSGPATPNLRFCMRYPGEARSPADVIGGDRRHVDELSVVRRQRHDLYRTIEPDQHRTDHGGAAKLHQHLGGDRG